MAKGLTMASRVTSGLRSKEKLRVVGRREDGRMVTHRFAKWRLKGKSAG
jgi:hypothetical protein